MKVVMDASAGVRLATGAWESPLLSDPRVDVIAPELFVSEITNACWKYHAINQLPLRQCEDLLLFALALVRTFIPCRVLCQDALQLSMTLRRPAYDMFYFALARREGALLLTADAKLKPFAERAGITLAM